MTSMTTLRAKSVALTSYLEELLMRPPTPHSLEEEDLPYEVITPTREQERGAQLSVRLRSGLLERVMKTLEDAGVIVDERRPDVIRVAPTPLYNTFEEVWDFVIIFTTACSQAQNTHLGQNQQAELLKGQNEKGWAEVQ